VALLVLLAEELAEPEAAEEVEPPLTDAVPVVAGVEATCVALLVVPEATPLEPAAAAEVDPPE
jgi:hypothetical protein